MTLDEWYLNYERLMQRHAIEMRKLTRLLPQIMSQSQPEPSSNGIVASTNTPDLEGQERLNLTPSLDEVA